MKSMMDDSSLRRSLDHYVKSRMKEIPSDINQTFQGTKKIWKCENELDFLYGYYVGKLEEGSIHFLSKATRASLRGWLDHFEIREIIESHRQELRDMIYKTIDNS